MASMETQHQTAGAGGAPVEGGRPERTDSARKEARVARLLSSLDAVYAYAVRMTGGSGREAEVVVETTYVRAAREAAGWKDSEVLVRLLEACEEVLGSRSAEASEAVRVEAARGVGNEGFEAASELLGTAAAVAGAVSELDRLPRELRAPVVLSDLQGLRYGEVAAVLRLPVGVVRERLYAGRAVLQAAMLERLRSGPRISRRAV